MASPEDQAVTKYIEEVAQSTRDGLIVWKAANPTTYYWDKIDATPTARLSLQQVERIAVAVENGQQLQRRMLHYVFQVFDLSGPSATVRLSIDTTDRQALGDALRSLFETIKRMKLQSDLEFLKSTLPTR